MPIYEYECDSCGNIEEALQKFTDKPLTTCRHCSGKLHRLISQSSFHLKGTGWYVTDYAKKQSKAETGPKGGGTGKADSAKSSTASEKTAATSDA